MTFYVYVLVPIILGIWVYKTTPKQPGRLFVCCIPGALWIFYALLGLFE